MGAALVLGEEKRDLDDRLVCRNGEGWAKAESKEGGGLP